MSLDFDRLRRFLVLSQTEHLRRAAEELRVPQSSLSGQISSLEEDLGVALVEKAGRGLRLTESGRVLAAEGKKLLAHVESIRQEVSRAAGGMVGTVRIGIPDLISMKVAEVTEIHAEHRPGVLVRVTEGPGALLHRMLMNHEIDLAVLDVERVKPSLKAKRYMKAHMYAFLSRGHVLARKDAISVYDLAQMQLLLYTRDFSHRAWLDAAFKSAGVTPQIRMESASSMTLLNWASRGLGIAVMDALPELLPRMTGVVYREMHSGGRPSTTQLAVAWDGDMALSTAAKELRDALLEDGSVPSS